MNLNRKLKLTLTAIVFTLTAFIFNNCADVGFQNSASESTLKFSNPSLIFQINNGDQWTKDELVSLGFRGVDVSDLYITNIAGCESGGSWVPYTEKVDAWFVSERNQNIKVYVKYKSTDGNISDCMYDDINHDNLGPVVVQKSGPESGNSVINPDVQINFSVNDAGIGLDPASLVCKLNNSAVDCNTEGVSLGSLNAGTYSLTVEANDLLGNNSTTSLTSFDVLGAPKEPFISINNGSAYTNDSDVTLSLASPDANEVYVTNDSSCSMGGAWETLNSSKAWTLGQENSTATVYAKFRRGANGVETECVNDSILHDNIKPVINIVSGPEQQSEQINPNVNFKYQIVEVGSGIDVNSLNCKLNNTSINCDMNEASLGRLEPGLHIFSIVVEDKASNMANEVSRSFTVLGAPTNPIVVINGNDDYTNSLDVSLQLSAADAQEVYVTNSANCIGGGQWESLVSPKAWSLQFSNSENKVYAKFRRGVNGIESLCASDSILHDGSGPVINVTERPSGETDLQIINIIYNITDNLSDIKSVRCELSSQSETVAIDCQAPEGSIQLTDLPPGNYNLQISAEDNANNIAYENINWEQLESNNTLNNGVINSTQPDSINYDKIDILFVTDTSGSINDEREAIANGLDRFINNLPSNIDYNVSLLLAHGNTSSNSGVLYEKNNEGKVLKSSTLNITQIKNSLRGKIYGPPGDDATDGGEVGIYSLDQLLTGDKFTQAQSDGFFRENAALAVIFVSDENDICARYPEGIEPVVDQQGAEVNTYNNLCVPQNITAQNTYQKLLTLQQGRPLTVTGVVYNNTQTIENIGENELGYGYLDMISLNGSISADIAGDIAAGLGNLGQLVSESFEQRTKFVISEAAITDCASQVVENSIVAKVNGQIVNHSWSSLDCSVQIDASVAGGPMAEVIITYDYWTFER